MHGPRAGGRAVRRVRPRVPIPGELGAQAPGVGASGAIFGLLGAIIVGQRAARISARASGMIPLLIINLVFTVAMPGISIGGHLGGLAGGIASGAVVFNRQLQGRNSAYALAGCVGIAVACFAAALGVADHSLRGFI